MATDAVTRDGSFAGDTLQAARTQVSGGDVEAGQIGGFSDAVVNNLRYPYSNSERQNRTMALQELTEADEILGRYFGPLHKVRTTLAPYLDDLRQKLGVL